MGPKQFETQSRAQIQGSAATTSDYTMNHLKALRLFIINCQTLDSFIEVPASYASVT